MVQFTHGCERGKLGPSCWLTWWIPLHQALTRTIFSSTCVRILFSVLAHPCLSVSLSLTRKELLSRGKRWISLNMAEEIPEWPELYESSWKRLQRVLTMEATWLEPSCQDNIEPVASGTGGNSGLVGKSQETNWFKQNMCGLSKAGNTKRSRRYS